MDRFHGRTKPASPPLPSWAITLPGPSPPLPRHVPQPTSPPPPPRFQQFLCRNHRLNHMPSCQHLHLPPLPPAVSEPPSALGTAVVSTSSCAALPPHQRRGNMTVTMEFGNEDLFVKPGMRGSAHPLPLHLLLPLTHSALTTAKTGTSTTTPGTSTATPLPAWGPRVRRGITASVKAMAAPARSSIA